MRAVPLLARRTRPARHARPARLIGAAVVSLALVAGTAGLATAPAYAASAPAKAIVDPDSCPDNDGLVAGGDIDNDGVSDVVVGIPTATVDAKTKAGAVDVTLSSGTRQHIVETLQGGVTANDEFGTAVALGTFVINGRCFGAAVGSPGSQGIGDVYFYAGSVGGLSSVGAISLQGSHLGDRFGTSIAAGDGAVYVGAPGATVNGHKGAGAIYEYSFNPLGGYNGFRPRVITEDTPGVPGTAETGDAFGSTVAATQQGVFVGSPGEGVGSAAGAGSVTFLSNGVPTLTKAWTQNSPGVPGTAEAGDHFGASLATPGGARDTGDVAIVGVPGEDVGSATDAGAVQLFSLNSSGSTWVPGAAYNQDSKGIPGTAEAGDQFGASVTYGQELSCGETFNAAVGAPGEDIGTVANAGSVTILPTGSSCAATSLSEGSGLEGHPQTGARVGAAVSTRSASYADDTDQTFDFLLIGAPGEPVTSQERAGQVIEIRPNSDGGASPEVRLGDSAGATAEEGYGGVISHSAS
jgi:hypothetical protein